MGIQLRKEHAAHYTCRVIGWDITMSRTSRHCWSCGEMINAGEKMFAVKFGIGIERPIKITWSRAAIHTRCETFLDAMSDPNEQVIARLIEMIEARRKEKEQTANG